MVKRPNDMPFEPPDFFNKIKPYLLIVLGIFILMTLNPFVIIGAGERGVVLKFGAVEDRIMQEGLNLRVPIMESVVKVDVKTQKYEAHASAASKDLQIVTTQIALNYHIDPSGVNWLFQNIGPGYRERIIDPAIQEAVKAATAQYTAEELITKRAIVRDVMKTNLGEKLGDLSDGNIIVNELNIVDFDFSDEFNRAIEQKVTAEQLALKAERDLDRIKIEAEQRVTQARAEADALLLTAKAQAEALKLQKLEVTPELTQFKAIERWDGKMPVYWGGDALPFINIGSKQKQPSTQ